MNKKLLLTYSALIATIIMWASAFIGIRIGIREYSAGSFALLRLGIAAICMIVFYAIKPPKQPLAKKDMFHAALLGVIGMGIYHAFLNLGEKTVTAGIASFIVAQVPIVTALIARIFFQERLRTLGWFGLLISAIGAALIAAGEIENSHFDFGVIYILVSAFATAIYISNAKQLLKRMHSFYLTAFVVFGGALSMLIFLPALIREIPLASANATCSAVYLGIFPTALAYISYNYALSKISRTTAASWLYAMPLVATFMAWLVLGEFPTLMAFFGGLIALAGAIVLNISSLKTNK
jgi:drug/metabolite transporter (DMT)-like permease